MTEPEKRDALDRNAVAARAYAIYVRRGMKPGREIDDWLEAERQLKSEALAGVLAKAPAPAPAPAAPARPAEPPAGGSKKKKGRKR